MNLDKLSVIFLNLFIISFPLSVTASQSFAVLSVFFFLLSSYTNNNLLVTLRNRAFVAAIGIYIALLPAIIANSSFYNVSLFSVLVKTEISDFWMSFAVLPAFYHIRNSSYRSSILRAIYISAFLLVVSGLVSIFTPFRLAPYITAGFKVKDGARLQHFAGEILGRYTYLPIGLMNTHLTFGGLCGLFFPGIIVNLLFLVKERNMLKSFELGLFSIVFSIVLFYNQSRSIWLGILFSFGLISIKLISSIKKENIKISSKYFFYILGIIMIICVATLVIYQKNWLIQRAFQEGLSDNTTENQRYFIYKNTLKIVNKKWFMGVGSGRFDEEHSWQSNEMISNNEQLWYELYITPRQHAHHDLLHFYTIGGIFGLIALLHFWFYLFRLFIKNPITPQTVLFSGILGIFIAGFFQCYLLDDEVALPFFAFIGLFAGSLQKEDARSKYIAEIKARKAANTNDSFLVESISLGSSLSYFRKKIAIGGKNSPLERYNATTLVAIFLPLAISLTYIVYKTRLEPMEVYKRKVKVSHIQNKKLVYQSIAGKHSLYPTMHMTGDEKIRIEGCLSHRFTNPISIRKDPFQIVMTLPFPATNPPTDVIINIIERDSFDQDKLYKVHQERKIGTEYSFPLNQNGDTMILLDDPFLFSSTKDSQRFPDNIYFRDFEFKFVGFDKEQANFDLPIINFGELCNAK